MNNFAKGCGAGVLLLVTSQVTAHHSAAMFDKSSTVTLHGTVREFQWTNPHCFIQLLATDGGRTVEWSIEMGAPTLLFRLGWRPSTLRAGQKVTIVVHALRDGSPGGQFTSGTRADGAPIGPNLAVATTP